MIRPDSAQRRRPGGSQTSRRRLAALIGVMASAGAAAGASDTAASIQQAEREAQARHARALRDCAGAANYAACVRDADAQLNDTSRGLAGERQRDAVPPGTGAQDAQRVQGQRLIRGLEQAAPKPLPSPSPGQPRVPGQPQVPGAPR